MSLPMLGSKISAEVWKLTRVTFTGAAILLREKAAYSETSFRMAS